MSDGDRPARNVDVRLCKNYAPVLNATEKCASQLVTLCRVIRQGNWSGHAATRADNGSASHNFFDSPGRLRNCQSSDRMTCRIVRVVIGATRGIVRVVVGSTCGIAWIVIGDRQTRQSREQAIYEMVWSRSSDVRNFQRHESGDVRDRLTPRTHADASLRILLSSARPARLSSAWPQALLYAGARHLQRDNLPQS